MRLITQIFLFSFLLTANSFGQNIKGENYEIEMLNDSNTGFYLESHYPSPFSPVLDIYFGIYDSAEVKFIVIHNSVDTIVGNRDTILNTVNILSKGNYRLDWSKFVKNLQRGYYEWSMTAIYKKWGMRSKFIGTQKKFLVIF